MKKSSVIMGNTVLSTGREKRARSSNRGAENNDTTTSRETTALYTVYAKSGSLSQSVEIDNCEFTNINDRS
jgi:hypothetical protein